MLRIADELLDRNDVRVLRHEEVAVEPGAGHVGVVPAQSGGKVGEDLLMQRVDRHLADVHLASGHFLPQRHIVLDAVADGQLRDQDVDGRSLVGLGLQEGHAFRSDRELVGRHGIGIDQIGRGPRWQRELRQRCGGQTELRAADNELAAADPAAHIIAHDVAEFFVIVSIGHSFLLYMRRQHANQAAEHILEPRFFW